MNESNSALLAIFKANQASHDQIPGSPSWTDEQFVSELNEHKSLVAIDNTGQPVAFILYRKTPIAFEISYLAAHPSSKREGYMTTLLKGLSIDARTQGVQIWLEVHEANNPAIRLYETFGFTLQGKRPKYYADGASALLYNYG